MLDDRQLDALTDPVKAWDVGLTLVATAKKLGVTIYQYIHDRRPAVSVAHTPASGAADSSTVER